MSAPSSPGDASSVSQPWPALVLLLIGLVIALPFARELNLLARGEITARALGVRVGRLRALVYGLGALLTAVAVTTVVYTLVTATSGIPLLVFAAALVGLVVAFQRRVTGGILGPAITHLTWSLGMLYLLPPVLDRLS